MNLGGETGTFMGDMIYAVERQFSEIHSIELGGELFEAARRRFAGLAHVHLHHGDSTTVLPELLKTCCDGNSSCFGWTAIFPKALRGAGGKTLPSWRNSAPSTATIPPPTSF